MAKSPKNEAEAEVAAKSEPAVQIAEVTPEPALVTFPDPPAPPPAADVIDPVEQVTAAVTEKKHPNEIAQEKEAARIAKLDAEKAAFVQKVMDARNPPEKPIVVQPVAPAIRKQTELEMAAGARMNRHFEQFHKANPQPKGHVPDGKTTSVFRPADYVPDQKKGQGRIQATELS